MTVGRNDNCPCGSGKKYKKCCLKKSQVVELRHHKEERFFSLKHQIVNNLHRFVEAKLPYSKSIQLQKEFRKAFGQGVSSQRSAPFFDLWLQMFHRFENGKRGIEWFLDEKASSMSQDELDLATTWRDLSPRIIQVVNQTDKGIWVEDYFTKEPLFMPYSETMPVIAPWSISFVLVEPFIEGYCIHGVGVWNSPDYLRPLVEKMKACMESSSLTYEQAAIAHYIELLSILLQPLESDLVKRPITTRKSVRLTYTINDKEPFIDWFMEEPSIVLNEWDGKNGDLSWNGDWLRYDDNAAPHPIYMAPTYARMFVQNNELIVDSVDEDKATTFIKMLEKIPFAVQLKNQEVTEIEVLEGIIFSEFIIDNQPDTPAYFSLFAQNELQVKEDMNCPIKKYGNRSIYQLLADQEIDLVEEWLRRNENTIYSLVKNTYGDVEHTYNINTIRKELGLPLSPFVTHSDQRETSLIPSGSPIEKPKRLRQADVPIFQLLGFTPDSAFEFYGQDIVDFYKKKTEGKAKATQSKYEFGLSLLTQYFMTDPDDIPSSWKEIAYEDWEEFLAFFFLNEKDDASVSQMKALLSVMNGFSKYIDDQYGTKHGAFVKEISTDIQEELASCIQLLDHYWSFTARKYHAAALSGLRNTISNAFSEYNEQINDLFLITDVNSTHATLHSFHSNRKNMYKLSLSGIDVRVTEGMIIDGVIGKNSTTWDLIDINRVYPKRALEYLTALYIEKD